MIVRIATFAPMAPEVEAESYRNLMERFKPALASQPGHVAGYWVKGEDGRMLSISVWESLEALERGGAAANAVPLLPGQDSTKIASPERWDIYTVVAHA